MVWKNWHTRIFAAVSLDIARELLQTRCVELQFDDWCFRTEITAYEGRRNIFRTSAGSVHSYWSYLCTYAEGLLCIWIVCKSWSCLLWDEKMWPSPKYVFPPSIYWILFISLHVFLLSETFSAVILSNYERIFSIYRQRILSLSDFCNSILWLVLLGSVVYNAYIEGLIKGGNSKKAIELYRRMKQERCEPTTDTYTMLINLYGKVSQ